MNSFRNTPARISVHQWHERMSAIPRSFSEECVYLRELGGVGYLRSPLDYACKGDTRLLRLKFDSSIESLRLWAFVFSEKDRLFLAKERGWYIFAAMKDLGQVPIITYAVPNSLTFYADELWWAPCFAEKRYLLDEAARFGATEELCFVRAALGAYKTLDYFPKPDLSFAAVGSCCDDFSAVMQLIERENNPVHWWEIPTRFDSQPFLQNIRFDSTQSAGSIYQQKALPFLVEQYKGIVKKLQEITGHRITEYDLRLSVSHFNSIRSKVRLLKDLVYGATHVPLPGLEMILVEFIALHYCSEPAEAHVVLDGIISLVKERIAQGVSPVATDAVRIFWVTPCTDAAIITFVEDLGACITGSEYMISHTAYSLDESKDPLVALAENYLDDPMIGSSEFRAQRIVKDAQRYRAQGVIISNIFGASHCAYEERVISQLVQKVLDIPVLAFDVPYAESVLSEQVKTRLEMFIELVRSRRDL